MKDPKLEKVLEAQGKEIEKIETGQSTDPAKIWENDQKMQYLLSNEKKVFQTLSGLPGSYVNDLSVGNHRYLVMMREDHKLTRKAIYAVMQLYGTQYKIEVVGSIRAL